MIVYEAFRPSGNETPPHSVGLFTGDEACVREFVALSGDYPYPLDQVQIYPREVDHMDKVKLDTWKAAKQKVTEGTRELEEAEQAIHLSS